MHATDRDEFLALLDQLAEVFGKPKLDDVKSQSYWRALRDLPLETIRRAAETHQRFGKFFPKPVELRPRDDKPPTEMSPKHEAELRAAIAYNRATWDELRRVDPERYAYAYEYGMAVAARAMATTEEGSPIYAQALAEFNHHLDTRVAAWERVREQRRQAEKAAHERGGGAA